MEGGNEKSTLFFVSVAKKKTTGVFSFLAKVGNKGGGSYQKHALPPLVWKRLRLVDQDSFPKIPKKRRIAPRKLTRARYCIFVARLGDFFSTAQMFNFENLLPFKGGYGSRKNTGSQQKKPNCYPERKGVFRFSQKKIAWRRIFLFFHFLGAF